MAYKLKINGKTRTAAVEPETPLLWVLRDTLGLPGTKFGCGAGICGACTVHIDGVAVRSCQMPVSDVGSQAVITIEGAGASRLGAKVQQAWIDQDVVQCGYCQAGQIMSAIALLSETPIPGDEEIDAAMSGNICRCATYVRIKAAIRQAAGIMPKPTGAPEPRQLMAESAGLSAASKGALS